MSEDSISISFAIFSYTVVIEEYAKKLTENQVYEIIVELYANELSMEEIGKDFGVSIGLISEINKGKTYPIDRYNYPVRETK